MTITIAFVMTKDKQNKTEKIEMRVTPEFKQRVHTAAQQKGLSISQFIVKMLEKVLGGHKR